MTCSEQEHYSYWYSNKLKNKVNHARNAYIARIKNEHREKITMKGGKLERNLYKYLILMIII
jgi:hypothetical protein